ncbi:MAG: hypothetical protein JWM93_3574 [Frankiales bacterium]|nr:hypothetical protein [Frankiales bacterium]
MAYDFQVTVDCAEPHVLADWWAETLGWEVEASNEEFIRSMVAQGFATEAETTTHRGVLVWATGQAILHPDTPEGMLRRRVLFQTVPEGKSVKNRVHLDLRVGVDNVEAVVDSVLARGGTFLHRGEQGPSRWVTVADLEGNEFCIG